MGSLLVLGRQSNNGDVYSMRQACCMQLHGTIFHSTNLPKWVDSQRYLSIVKASGEARVFEGCPRKDSVPRVPRRSIPMQ